MAFRYKEGDELKYVAEGKELAKPERNTLIVDFSDIEKFNPRLKEAISDQCYRLYPYLCNAVSNFVRESPVLKDSQIPGTDQSGQVQIPPNKEFYVAFQNVSHSYKYVFFS